MAKVNINNITMMDVLKLKPYKNNAKVHTRKQIEEIAKSIDEFGFADPVGVWHNENGEPEIVTGHGAVLAAIRRGIEEIPCVILDELTDEERRAFCHIHNQLTLSTEIDYDALKCDFETLSTSEYSWEDFGFNTDNFNLDSFSSAESFGEELNERERTFAAYNMHLAAEVETEPDLGIPIIKPCNYIPEDLLGFNYAMTSEDKEKGIHFFVDDYQFERVWNQPERYTEILKDYQCVLTPDFSLYTDMNKAVWIWNVYRSRLLGAYWQYCGLNVIPTLQWSDERSFDFVFKGLPKNSTVAVSTVGVMRDDESFNNWKLGMTRALEEVKPKRILLYGVKPDYDFPEDISVVEFAAFGSKIKQRS